MKSIIPLCLVLSWSSMTAQNSKTIINKMIEAHGGLEKWRTATSLSFEKEEPTRNMTVRSVESIEPITRRVHIVWPDLKSELYSDGKDVWSSNWSFPFPPKMLALIDFYFLSLPWVTQDPGVVLGTAEKGRLPGDSRDYLAVKMTFAQSTGWTPDDYFTLMIDPDTYELKGAEWITTDAAALDANQAPLDAKYAGPFYYVIRETKKAGGLLFMTRYQQLLPDGTPFGGGAIWNIRLDNPFDERWTHLKTHGQLDTSNPRKRKKM